MTKTLVLIQKGCEYFIVCEYRLFGVFIRQEKLTYKNRIAFRNYNEARDAYNELVFIKKSVRLLEENL